MTGSRHGVAGFKNRGRGARPSQLIVSVRPLVTRGNMRIQKKPLVIALLFMSQSIWASTLNICVYDILKVAALRGRILVNQLATFRAEVQFDKKDMARNINYSCHRCMFDRIFCGKTEGIESDTPEQNGRSRTAYTPT